MSRLTRDGTTEPVSPDQILRHVHGQGDIHFPCSVDHEQDWQPYPVDPYSAVCDDHTYIYIHIYIRQTDFLCQHTASTNTINVREYSKNRTLSNPVVCVLSA